MDSEYFIWPPGTVTIEMTFQSERSYWYNIKHMCASFFSACVTKHFLCQNWFLIVYTHLINVRATIKKEAGKIICQRWNSYTLRNAGSSITIVSNEFYIWTYAHMMLQHHKIGNRIFIISFSSSSFHSDAALCNNSVIGKGFVSHIIAVISWWARWRFNHLRIYCLLHCLFRTRSKKTSRLHAIGLWEGNPPVTGASPHKGTTTRKMFPFDAVIMW